MPAARPITRAPEATAPRTPIGQTVVIEDSRVGAIGALASGAWVIGLAAGTHCLDGHADMLRDLGVADIADSFEELRRMLSLD